MLLFKGTPLAAEVTLRRCGILLFKLVDGRKFSDGLRAPLCLKGFLTLFLLALAREKGLEG